MNAVTAASLPPKWFWMVAIAALLWNLIGVAMFLMQFTMSAEALAALPVEQRTLFAAMPAWGWGAYGVAVFAGAFGSLLLLLKKRAALPMLVISLLAVLAHSAYIFFFSDAFTLVGPGGMVLPTLVLVTAVLLVWFARRSAARGWIG